MARQRFGLWALFAVAMMAVVIALHDVTPALADTDIASAGPLTDIFISSGLNCQALHTSDGSTGEFYSPGSTYSTDCATWLFTNGTSYGTFTSNPFTPISQSAVTGSGTAG